MNHLVISIEGTKKNVDPDRCLHDNYGRLTIDDNGSWLKVCGVCNKTIKAPDFDLEILLEKCAAMED